MLVFDGGADRTVETVRDFKDALGVDKDRPILLKVYKPQANRTVFVAVER